MSSATTTEDSDDEEVLNTIIRAGHLTDALEILQSLAGEAIIHFGDHGIRASVISPSTVAMHNPLEIHEEGFEHIPDGSFALGVNLERLDDMLSKADSDTPVNLAFKPATRMLNIQYGGLDADLACIDPDSIREEPDDPGVDLPNQFTVESGAWADAIETADLVSDHMILECYPESGEVEVRGEGDADDVRWTFDSDDFVGDTKLTENTVSIFSIDYMTRVKKAMPGGEVAVTVGEEFPVYLEYEIADGHGDVVTMVAPRLITR